MQHYNSPIIIVVNHEQMEEYFILSTWTLYSAIFFTEASLHTTLNQLFPTL